jgi:hypothetical protein
VTGRTWALALAVAIVPALWGWLVPRLLARTWPAAPPETPPRPPFPDFEI